MHFGNNDNSNNNGNNNNNNQNDNSNNGNNNGNTGSNSGNVNNSNPPVTNPTNSFGGSGQLDVTVPNSGSPAGINANVNCLVSQNGNNIQLGLDLFPTSVPSSLQSTFSNSGNSDYLFNFDGTTSNTDSGTQITANAQGSLNSGSTFNLDLNGTIDQAQDTFTLTLTSEQTSQMGITTPQAISLHLNNNNGNNNNSNNNSSNNPNNNSGGVTPIFQGGQINTAQKTITLTFSVTNGIGHDTTINSMSGTLEITADQYSLGTVSSTGPVTIPLGQTATITVSGPLTQNDLNYLNNHYSHATSVDVTVVNGKMTEDGVTNQGGQSQDLGNIPIS